MARSAVSCASTTHSLAVIPTLSGQVLLYRSTRGQKIHGDKIRVARRWCLGWLASLRLLFQRRTRTSQAKKGLDQSSRPSKLCRHQTQEGRAVQPQYIQVGLTLASAIHIPTCPNDRFVFDLGEGKASLLPIASCVYLRAEDFKDANGKPMQRPYTPISPSDLEGELTFIVKKYETGNVSKYIHSLKPGDKLAVKGPLPKWSWKSNSSLLSV